MKDSQEIASQPSLAQQSSPPTQLQPASIVPIEASVPPAINQSASEREYIRAREKFDAAAGSFSGDESVVKIRDLINIVGKNIQTWDISQLATAEERLARHSAYLGESYAEADTKAEFLSAYLKDNQAKQWSRIKESILKRGEKATSGEVEREILAATWEDICQELFWRGRAKQYRMILEAMDRVQLAITHRIRDAERQWQAAKNPRL